MFLAALFTTARTWKQLRCPPTDERIKNMRCTHTMEYYSATEKMEMMPQAAARVDLSEVRQRKTNIT